MEDISQVPTDELLRMYNGAPPERAPLQITVRPSDAHPELSRMSTEDLIAAYHSAQPAQMSAAEDVARSLGSGVVHGITGLVGLPAQVAEYGARGIDKATQAVGRAVGMDLQRPKAEGKSFLPTSEDAARFVEEYLTGPLHKPQTTAGQYAHTVGEFLPGSVLGPGGLAGNVIKFGVVPALASEAVGQSPMVRGTSLEPVARTGAALLSGGGAALLARPSNVGRTVSRAAGGVTDIDLNAAEALFQEAQRAGTPITRAEALQHVTNGGTDLGNLQRVVEGSGQLREFFSGRPASNDAAARRAFDGISTQAPLPSQIGPEVSTAAGGAIDQVRGTINNASRPFYDSAMRQYVSPQEFATFSNNPVWVDGVRRVRNDPIIGPTLNGLPDNSLAVVDAVKKQLDETGRNLRDPMAGTARNNYAASIIDAGNKNIVASADRATGSTPNVAGTYETARYIQSESRRRFLDPLMNGPLGKLAESKTTRDAIEALFPANPIPNSAAEVNGAVTAVVNRNPWAARQLVRAHAESVFDQSARRLVSGENEFGGAKFAAAIRGNPQQAENLGAAVRALPNGNQTWEGFDRFLNILEAQGQRQRIGAQTAFNQEALADLKRGSFAGDAATLAAGIGVKWPQKIKDSVERWRLGHNLDQLAYLLTDPAAGREFARLVKTPTGSTQAAALAARIITMTSNASAERPPAVNRQAQ